MVGIFRDFAGGAAANRMWTDRDSQWYFWSPVIS